MVLRYWPMTPGKFVNQSKATAISGAAITVTEARVSPDLRNATVFVMPLGGGEAARKLAALQRAAPFLRSEIARSLNLRFTPSLKFELDQSFDTAQRIEDTLRDPRVRRDLDGGTGDSDAS